MKTVFGNSDLVHTFAQRTQSDGGLEETYNYLTSDQQVLETLECNDYEFTEDGNIY